MLSCSYLANKTNRLIRFFRYVWNMLFYFCEFIGKGTWEPASRTFLHFRQQLTSSRTFRTGIDVQAEWRRTVLFHFTSLTLITRKTSLLLIPGVERKWDLLYTCPFTPLSPMPLYTRSPKLWGRGWKSIWKGQQCPQRLNGIQATRVRNKPVLNGMRLRSKSGRSKWFLVLHVHISLTCSLLAITRVYTGVALNRLRQGRRLFHLYASSWNNSIPSLIFAVTSKTLPPTNTSLTTLNGQVSNHLTCGEKPKHSKETQTVTGRMWKLHAAQHQRSGLNRCCWSCEAASQGVLWSQLKDEAG